MKHSEHTYTNALIHETSPYLLQHAHNPVDWHAWNAETLEKAKREDKLLLISIGYSACHWCHVMEHESFEDSTVAQLMNDNFIPIKVDREERPDVDDVYLTACELVNGSGGWPLNAVALPDGRPVWAGTYFPKERWIDILNQFKTLKEDSYPKLVESAEKLVSGVQQVDEVVDVSAEVDFLSEELELIGERLVSNIDLDKGGIKGRQKFPLPSNYFFLLKYAYKNPDSQASLAVQKTLSAMARGGIYDQIEGAWSRYTVDDEWMIPHFEKMLYDNGQLLELFSDAYKVYQDPLYKEVVEASISFMQKHWKDEAGGYYSSFDADSEGEEGKFYVWTYEEVKELIPPEDFEEFVEYYNITEKGNWEHDQNILHVDRTRASEDQEMLSRVMQWKKILVEKRAERVFPGLDDKVLCSWNALLISGFVAAYEAFGSEEYKAEAIAIWDFIEDKMLDSDLRLNRNYKNGKSTINAFLDDYAFVIKALSDLYQVTFDEKYLRKAESLTKYVIEHFSSSESAMFNYTSDLDPPLIAKKSEISDGAIPGSNSVMARNLHTLGLFLYNEEFLEASKQMARNMKNTLLQSKQPNFYANWCSFYFDLVHEPYEVAILGPDSDRIRDEMMSDYHPNALFLGGKDEGGLQLLSDKLQEGENYIYVCVKKSCKIPVQTSQEALGLLD